MAEDARVLPIEERNRQFMAMSPAERRVLVAKDVIAALRAEIVTPVCEQYLIPHNLNQRELHENLQDVLARDQKDQCAVCARGALFLVEMFRRGRDDSKDLWANDYESEFPLSQLYLMEAAFECRVLYFHCERLTEDQLREAVNFGSRYEEDGNRMIAIMQNVIAHGGEFVP